MSHRMLSRCCSCSPVPFCLLPFLLSSRMQSQMRTKFSPNRYNQSARHSNRTKRANETIEALRTLGSIAIGPPVSAMMKAWAGIGSGAWIRKVAPLAGIGIVTTTRTASLDTAQTSAAKIAITSRGRVAGSRAASNTTMAMSSADTGIRLGAGDIFWFSYCDGGAERRVSIIGARYSPSSSPNRGSAIITDAGARHLAANFPTHFRQIVISFCLRGRTL